MIPKRIVVIGGSTVYGQGDPNGGGFVSRLRGWHESQNIESNRVFNLGVGGDAVAEMLLRGAAEARARRPDLIIVYPGLNDTRRVGSVGAPPQTAPDIVERTLYQLVGELQLIAPVVLMSAVPPDETRTKPFWGKWFFIIRDAEQMAARVCSVAQTTRAPYLPIFERWRSHPDRLALVSDGLHCNPEGHQLLFREVSNFLLETFALEA